MTADEIKRLLTTLMGQAKAVADTAKTASSNQKSLSGSNFYADKFHQQCVVLTATQNKLKPALTGLPEAAEQVAKLEDSLRKLTNDRGTGRSHADAFKAIQGSIVSHLLPGVERLTASPIPATEQVLPMAVVEGTRGYLESVVLQANGCYEHQWYDACSVMIRRLVETLIIEVYEADKRLAEITDANNHILMLNGLISTILDDKTYHLGRETREGLPLLKSGGDRAAHHRQYTAKKPDVDKIIFYLRVIVVELLHLARLRT